MSKSIITKCVLILTFLSQISVIAVDIDSTQVDPVTIFILQDYVDNFEHGFSAGGPLTAFGNVLGQFQIVENAGQGGQGAAVQLYTVGTGFGATTSQQFIGFNKKIDPTTLVDAANAKFDANNFNAISYFIKDATGNSPTVANSPVDIVLEITIGDGGDTSPEDTSDTKTGSTWTQKVPIKLADLNSSFTRVVSLLDNSDFTRSVNPTDVDTHTDLSTLKSDITAVTITMLGNNETGKIRGIMVDDINFFDNNVMTVKQDRVFVKSDGSTIVTVTATVKDAAGAGQPDVGINFIVNDSSSPPSDLTKFTNGSGIATFNYTATNNSDIVKISVEQRNP
jgi:hypothetical protein